MQASKPTHCDAETVDRIRTSRDRLVELERRALLAGEPLHALTLKAAIRALDRVLTPTDADEEAS